MSCAFEQSIALYVEGDLAESERIRVEEHLQACVDCGLLAGDLKESQAAFKAIRQDVPDAAALSSLRERVLAEVAASRPGTWFERLLLGGLRKAVLAGVVLFAIGAGSVWLMPSTPVAPAEPVHVAVNEPPPVVEVFFQIAEPPVAPRVVRRLSPAAVHPEHPVIIKLLTDDPTVVIYWLPDEKGD